MQANLADRCRDSVSSNIAQQAIRYVQRRHVHLFEFDDSVLNALVQGSEMLPHMVRIKFPDSPRGGFVRAACSCAYFDHGVCKHIWATILQFDAHRLYTHVPGVQRLLLKADAELLGEILHDIEDSDDADVEADVPPAIVVPHPRSPAAAELAPSARPVGRSGNDTRAVRSDSWHQALDQIGSVHQHDPLRATPTARAVQDAQVWYVIDLDATFRRGRLIVRVMQRERRRDGRYGRLKPFLVTAERLASLADSGDREVLRLALDARLGDDTGQQSYSYSYAYIEPLRLKQFRIPRDLYPFLLPRMCSNGRTVLPQAHAASSAAAPPAASSFEKSLAPVRWDGDLPWRFELKISRAAPDDAGAPGAGRAEAASLAIRGVLKRSDETREVTEPVLLLSEGLIIWPDALALLDAAEAFHWISTLRQRGRLFVPSQEEAQFVERLARLPALPQLDWGAEIAWQQRREVPRPRLEIGAPRSSAPAAALHGIVRFVYGAQVVDPQGEGHMLVDSESRVMVLRDTAAEAAALRQLVDLGVREASRYIIDPWERAIEPADFARIVRELVTNGWEVFASGNLVRAHGAFNFSVTSGIDWFDLDGRLEFDGAAGVALPELLAAVERQERFVRLDDGSHGILPQEWLERFAPWLQLGKSNNDRLRFVPAQAMMLDAMLRDAPQVSMDAQFTLLRQELRNFDGIRPLDPTPAFSGTLRDYQRLGLGWLSFLQRFGLGGCLADDMGLGKTVQILALLAARHVTARSNAPDAPARPSLVVAPRSVVYNWIEEAHRFVPELRVLDYTGAERSGLHEQFSAHDVVVTTYGTLRRDIFGLKDRTFDYVILDEAQAIKNAASQSAKASRLLQASHRLALTGTPVENHVGELWSIFEFLNPGMLTAKILQRTNSTNGSPRVGEMRQADDSGDGRGGSDRGGNGARADGDGGLLGWALRPFILRRTKERVLAELPQKTEQTLFCEMDAKQRRLYFEVRDFYRAKLTQHIEANTLGRSKIQVLEALLRLRQVACHPELVSPKHASVPSAKIEALVEQLDEVLSQGHKALVFSQFTKFLGIVRRHVYERGWAHEYLDGRVLKRKDRVERFQNDPECRLFLISLKAGGLGLNLTAADYVFILDPWWNPAVEAQAVDRAHRIGQTRSVFAYRLICRDTVEERILELQAHKRQLAESILANDGSLIRDLTAADLTLLLS